MKRALIVSLLLPPLLIGAVLGAVAVFDGGTEEAIPAVSATPSESPSPTPSPTAEPTDEPSPSPTPKVCADNPDPATDENVQVDSPSPGDEVASPVYVSGRVAAFEAVFQITIYDASGAVIADQSGLSELGQELSPFSEDVLFSVAVPTPACLWVYELSAADGTQIHIAQVPITLKP